MPQVSFTELMDEANRGRYAVGYFESWNLESTLAVASAAEATGSPVIIGFSGIHLSDSKNEVHEPLSVYAEMGRQVARSLAVPCCLLFNESPKLKTVEEAIELGFDLVMYSEEGLSRQQLIHQTKRLVSLARPHGVAVEAELEALAGVGGELAGQTTDELRLTDPTQVRQFVDETGIDALAVNVGQVHLHGRKMVRLDLERLHAIRETVHTPLVLHGSSSVAPTDIRGAIELGVRKVNVGSALKQAYFEALRAACGDKGLSGNPYEIVGSGRANDVLVRARKAMQRRVEELMLTFGSVGRHAVRQRSYA